MKNLVESGAVKKDSDKYNYIKAVLENEAGSTPNNSNFKLTK